MVTTVERCQVLKKTDGWLTYVGWWKWYTIDAMGDGNPLWNNHYHWQICLEWINLDYTPWTNIPTARTLKLAFEVGRWVGTFREGLGLLPSAMLVFGEFCYSSLRSSHAGSWFQPTILIILITWGWLGVAKFETFRSKMGIMGSELGLQPRSKTQHLSVQLWEPKSLPPAEFSRGHVWKVGEAGIFSQKI